MPNPIVKRNVSRSVGLVDKLEAQEVMDPVLRRHRREYDAAPLCLGRGEGQDRCLQHQRRWTTTSQHQLPRRLRQDCATEVAYDDLASIAGETNDGLAADERKNDHPIGAAAKKETSSSPRVFACARRLHQKSCGRAHVQCVSDPKQAGSTGHCEIFSHRRRLQRSEPHGRRKCIQTQYVRKSCRQNQEHQEYGRPFAAGSECHTTFTLQHTMIMPMSAWSATRRHSRDRGRIPSLQNKAAIEQAIWVSLVSSAHHTPATSRSTVERKKKLRISCICCEKTEEKVRYPVLSHPRSVDHGWSYPATASSLYVAEPLTKRDGASPSQDIGIAIRTLEVTHPTCTSRSPRAFPTVFGLLVILTFP